jgi:hypothetical protein
MLSSDAFLNFGAMQEIPALVELMNVFRRPVCSRFVVGAGRGEYSW